MTTEEILDSYNFYIEEAVDDYLQSGCQNDVYKYLRGVVFGLGFALGYRHDKVTSDLNNAIADAKFRILSEAI